MRKTDGRAFRSTPDGLYESWRPGRCETREKPRRERQWYKRVRVAFFVLLLVAQVEGAGGEPPSPLLGASCTDGRQEPVIKVRRHRLKIELKKIILIFFIISYLIMY